MNDASYTPISRAAVASVVLALLSLGGAVFHPLALLAVPGVVFGFVALHETKKYATGGRRVALCGLTLSALIGIGGPLLEVSFYRSEAPAGYRRLSHPDNLGESELDQYIGENVCLKGYALPVGETEVSRFLLTCNGYSRDPRNPVVVELADGRLWEMEYGGVAVSGRMELLPTREDDPDMPRYVLRDAIVRPSRTIYQLAARDTSDGC